ncbi:MAG: sodium:solute symporter [Bacteroidales bacterium]
MATLDWIVLGFFCAGLVWIIIWVARKKNETSTDYFLAGRDATWLAIGSSIFASNIGSEHLVGLAGAGASTGMAMAHWEMHGWLILILGWFFVPFYARSGVFTMPEFLERRYNKGSRSVLSIISLVSYVFTKVAVTVYAGGIVFKQVFGIESIMGIDFFWISAVGLVVLTGIYTTLGGMKAVLWTSVLQTPILLVGSVAILVIGLIKLGGWSEMMEICRAVPVNADGDTMTQLMRSANDPEYPWTGVILGSAIIGFWYWCTDQFIVQRVLSGRNQAESRRGAILGAAFKLSPVFIFLIPGMIAYSLNAKGMISLPNPDSAFSVLVKELLPLGFKGLVVGGILAALMSSLASLFNSSATLFTVDFYQKYKPNAPEKELVKVGRIATVVVVVLGILWIPVMRGLGKALYAYLQDVQSMLAPGIAAVFLLGVSSRWITPKAGLIGLLTGFVLGMTRLAFKVLGSGMDQDGILYQIFLKPNGLHYEIVLFFLVIILMIIVSAVTPQADQVKIKGLYFGSATAEEKAVTKASYNNWDLFFSGLIIAVIIAFYAYFW